MVIPELSSGYDMLEVDGRLFTKLPAALVPHIPGMPDLAGRWITISQTTGPLMRDAMTPSALAFHLSQLLAAAAPGVFGCRTNPSEMSGYWRRLCRREIFTSPLLVPTGSCASCRHQRGPLQEPLRSRARVLRRATSDSAVASIGPVSSVSSRSPSVPSGPSSPSGPRARSARRLPSVPSLPPGLVPAPPCHLRRRPMPRRRRRCRRTTSSRRPWCSRRPDPCRKSGISKLLPGPAGRPGHVARRCQRPL